MEERFSKFFFKILFLFISLLTFAQEIRFARIDSLLHYLYENDKFMGSLCIRQGDEVVFKQAYGYSEATKGVRANGAPFRKPPSAVITKEASAS